MASGPTGTKQKTYYVREDLAKVIAHIASHEDKRESDVVNDAFHYFVNDKLTEEQLRVFGYKEETNNGHASGTNGVASRSTSERAGSGSRNGASSTRSKVGSPPGTKKRAGEDDGTRRRSTK